MVVGDCVGDSFTWLARCVVLFKAVDIAGKLHVKVACVCFNQSFCFALSCNEFLKFRDYTGFSTIAVSECADI